MGLNFNNQITQMSGDTAAQDALSLHKVSFWRCQQIMRSRLFIRWKSLQQQDSDPDETFLLETRLCLQIQVYCSISLQCVNQHQGNLAVFLLPKFSYTLCTSFTGTKCMSVTLHHGSPWKFPDSKRGGTRPIQSSDRQQGCFRGQSHGYAKAVIDEDVRHFPAKSLDSLLIWHTHTSNACADQPLCLPMQKLKTKNQTSKLPKLQTCCAKGQVWTFLPPLSYEARAPASLLSYSATWSCLVVTNAWLLVKVGDG